MSTSLTLGERIDDLMKEKGINNAQLAKIIDTPPGNLSKIRNGENTNPKIGLIIKLADYFEVTSDYLLGLSEYKTATNANIGKTTGLSDENIELLSTLKEKLMNDPDDYYKTAIYILNTFIQQLLTTDYLYKPYFTSLGYDGEDFTFLDSLVNLLGDIAYIKNFSLKNTAPTSQDLIYIVSLAEIIRLKRQYLTEIFMYITEKIIHFQEFEKEYSDYTFNLFKNEVNNHGKHKKTR